MTKKTHAERTSAKPLYRFAALAAVLLAVCLVFMMPVSAEWTADTSWSSNYDDSATEFTIADAGDLAQFAKMVNEGNTFQGKTVMLTADINLENQEWTPIGLTKINVQTPQNSKYSYFLGTFDGGNKIISNLSITSTSNSIILGLFGSLGYDNQKAGTVKNLHVSGKIEITTDTTSTLETNILVGGIAGLSNGGTIENCHSAVDIKITNQKATLSSGGIVSSNMEGTIKNCYSTGDINVETTGDYVYAGGITGQNQNPGAQISNCYSISTVTASGKKVRAGGIVGQNSESGTISNCYALNKEISTTTTLTTDSHAGRVAGENGNTNLEDNFGWAGMKVNNNVVNPVNGNTDTQGKLVYAKDVWEKSFTNFDSSVWEVTQGQDSYPLPVIKNLGTPDKSKVSYLEPKVKLTYNVNGGSGTLPTEENYVSGEPAKIASTDGLTKEGSHANGWNTKDDGTGTDYVQNAYLTIGNSEVTLYVKWTTNPPETYTVTFMSNGESVKTQTVTAGNYAENHAITLAGHNFIGWFAERNPQKFNFGTPVTSDITLIAKWSPIVYKLQINNEDGTSFGTYYLAYGDEITNVGAPKIGYTFVGFTPKLPEKMPADNLTVTAKWTINQYTITFNTSGGSVIPPITQDYNTDIIAPANPTKYGYIFVGWDKEIPSKMPAEDITITAQWEALSNSGEARPSGSATDTGSGNYNEYPRQASGTAETISFGTSKIVKTVDLPDGVTGEVKLIAKSENPGPKDKDVHHVFEINIPNYPTGKEAVISFELTLAELDANGVSPEDICLYHFDKETGVWTKLATTYKVVGDKVIYEAVTTGFSPFAIVFEKGAATPAAGADEPVTPPTETPDVPDTPVTPQQPTDKPDEPETPAPILAVLAGLGAAVILRRK